jgi:hypothetical protein
MKADLAQLKAEVPRRRIAKQDREKINSLSQNPGRCKASERREAVERQAQSKPTLRESRTAGKCPESGPTVAAFNCVGGHAPADAKEIPMLRMLEKSSRVRVGIFLGVVTAALGCS